MAKTSKSLVSLRRARGAELVRWRRDDRTPCPGCGRLTKTVGRGTCADCWQPKTVDGHAGIAPQKPRTEPLGLLDALDAIPDIVWILAALAAVAALARVLIGSLV